MESIEAGRAVLGAFGGLLVGWVGAGVLGRLRVPVRRPWCALAAGAACGLCGALGGPPWWVAVQWTLSCFGVLLAAADLSARRLPDVLTGAAFLVLAVVLAVAPTWGADTGVLGRAAVGVLLFCGAHLLVHLLAPHGMGAGDVKLAAPLGAVLGVLGVPSLLLGCVLAAGGTAGLVLGARLLRTRRWADGVPHGPSLLLATWTLALVPASVPG